MVKGIRQGQFSWHGQRSECCGGRACRSMHNRARNKSYTQRLCHDKEVGMLSRIATVASRLAGLRSREIKCGAVLKQPSAGRGRRGSRMRISRETQTKSTQTRSSQRPHSARVSVASDKLRAPPVVRPKTNATLCHWLRPVVAVPSSCTGTGTARARRALGRFKARLLSRASHWQAPHAFAPILIRRRSDRKHESWALDAGRRNGRIAHGEESTAVNALCDEPRRHVYKHDWQINGRR